MFSLFRFWSLSLSKWEKQWHAILIVSVVSAKKMPKVAFFKLDPDQDVDGASGCKEQMSRRHVRRCPEGDDKSKHHGLSKVTVEASGLEFHMMVCQ